ncbi:hypothetical protein VCUG_01147 [Vavraia culicis subsp. floridensis]|uniref:Uncharacterized protein n=1 Tax=Vavraia culicis (isolate floridensis) TaxID=948595 RepID=L2GVT3_VAVCU|nr:uncharacterized protein VCUG_01147 [Vavraia culicis subsp. floridensis]ELA47378.1 hypothetical protein VCUG_01147 [Vavraia culicis subsp. floridensis]
MKIAFDYVCCSRRIFNADVMITFRYEYVYLSFAYQQHLNNTSPGTLVFGLCTISILTVVFPCCTQHFLTPSNTSAGSVKIGYVHQCLIHGEYFFRNFCRKCSVC